MNERTPLFLLFFIFLFSACSSTKHLKEGEYMLMKNSIIMEDVKGAEFDDLIYVIRPETNKKFALFFNLKTGIYANSQPKIDTAKGTVKDSKFRQWLRNSIGEPPVLLDSMQIDNSVEQLRIGLKKMGYFTPVIQPEVVFSKSNDHKAKVNYHVTANEPYFIREVQYSIDIPEFRRIIILDSSNSLLRKGMRYNENIISQERMRITNHIRDHGYYYASSSIVTVEVDTFNSALHRDKKGHRTVSLNIQVNLNYIPDPAKEKVLTKYYFDNVYIYTDYDVNLEQGNNVDTVIFRSFRDKEDSTFYYFITPRKMGKHQKKNKLYKDFKYKTITDILYTKKGWQYSQSSYDRSFRRLSDLNNFNIINIEFIENKQKLDTFQNKGVLDVRYRLTRSKLHSFSTELDIRSDKSNLAFTYTNRNIFKGAEHLNINIYGGIYYYYLFIRRIETLLYYDLGGSISLDFPRLFIFRQTQKIEALRYSTSIKFGANYNWYFKRLMLNAGITYRWSPNYHINHSLTPLTISTIDSARNRASIAAYPEEYRNKFNKRIIVALNYTFNYLVPFKSNKHNLRLTFEFESSGLTVLGINKLNDIVQNRDQIWKIAGYNYATYELGELTLRYYYNFNKNNTIAARFNLGVAIPFYDFRNNSMPFERSFYLGGANSMRAWSFRSVGPGSYYSERYMEKTGDIKLELNLEFRGTIYKTVKYGLFVDVGNTWLSREYADMPGANFAWNRFYKELAIGVGAGLRLDFNFFLIRIDYGIPIYDPSAPGDNKFINSSWLQRNENNTTFWKFGQGFQFAIGHAF